MLNRKRIERSKIIAGQVYCCSDGRFTYIIRLEDRNAEHKFYLLIDSPSWDVEFSSVGPGTLRPDLLIYEATNDEQILMNMFIEDYEKGSK